MPSEGIELLKLQSSGSGDTPPAVHPLHEIAIADLHEEKISTVLGDITVHVAGNKRKPAILTFHDIGQNAHACFQGFFQFSDMAAVAEQFFIVHVNAPGQEVDAGPLPENYVYPSMNDLADMLSTVMDHFQLRSVIGFGVGAGANVLCRFALKHPKSVNALILINASVTQAGWVEWAYQKMNISYLFRRGMTTFTVDYLMWHHFGKNWQQMEKDLVREYYQYFCRLQNPRSLAAFIEAYINRTDLDMNRQGDTLTCPTLLLVGQGPHIDETVDTNSRLDPTKTSWIKLSDCGGMVLDEAPDKVTECVMLFLQGEGYLSSINYATWKRRRSSITSPGGALSPPSAELLQTDETGPAPVAV